jgi:hypothetical protein
MDEFSKLLHYSPSGNSSMDDDVGDDVSMFDEGLEDIDKARIHFLLNTLEVRHFCEDVAKGLIEYREHLDSKPSRMRQLDLNVLEDIISEPLSYRTKEACIMLIKEKLDGFKTGFLIYKGKSRLKNMIQDIIDIHTSSQLKRARDELMLEMCAHMRLLKKFNSIRGEDLGQLKSDLIAARIEIDGFRQREISEHRTESGSLERVVVSRSFVERFTSVFRK